MTLCLDLCHLLPGGLESFVLRGDHSFHLRPEQDILVGVDRELVFPHLEVSVGKRSHVHQHVLAFIQFGETGQYLFRQCRGCCPLLRCVLSLVEGRLVMGIQTSDQPVSCVESAVGQLFRGFETQRFSRNSTGAPSKS